MGQQTNKRKSGRSSDDEYKSAVQPLVDAAMEAHNLAPAIKEAIVENKPLNDQLQKVIAEAIERNPDVQGVLDKVISNNEAIKKSKASWRQPAFIITTLIAVAGVIVAIIALFR